MKSREIVKQLRAEAAQLLKAANMIEGSVQKRGRPAKVSKGEPGKRRGRPPKKKTEDVKD
jgi:hypothetical protein